jgi:hypothetical protein
MFSETTANLLFGKAAQNLELRRVMALGERHAT